MFKKLIISILCLSLITSCKQNTQSVTYSSNSNTDKIPTNSVNVLLTQSTPKNVVVLKHKSYVTYFDTVAHYPYMVIWDLSPSRINPAVRLKRKNNFVADPLLEYATSLTKYYAKGGYDRGHLSSAEDNEMDVQSLIECFYYSNMCPQLPALNRGDWKELETYCDNLARKGDNLTIYAGATGHNGNLGIVWIPTYCWKVIKDHKDGHVEAYIMPNSINVNNFTYDHYKVDVKDVQKLTGYSFN